MFPSGYYFIRQVRALQKPAKGNNPDSMIDYSFPEQDDIEKFARGTPKGRQYASGGIV